MRRLNFALLLALAASPLLAANRLPQNVIPDHYAIRIAPDLAAETFAGEETIDVDVKESTDSVVLHSIGLTLRDVAIDAGGKHLTGTVTADEANETVAIKLSEAVPAGRAALHVVFDGKLLPQLRGLYLSKTAKRKYAATQFEAQSARRAFPCFDEPAMKATFDITLVVDAGDTAISNEAIVSDKPAGEGKHALKFGTTKRLPTYLVAMLVGDFQCIEGTADGLPIRVCTTPGLQNLGHFALAAAQASISFFNRYYDIKYPFGKLDMIGIPDFAAGAMENAGAIVYRETDLLIDEKTASTIVQKRVAEVVSHEVAHMWFGDLVTMKWWNDLWLNEGFATFMSEKPIEAWKPEWRVDLNKPLLNDEALTVDSQRSTIPIRSEGAGFDPGITYGKTAAVLRMIEAWIGPDTFRDAIRIYLKKYSFSNAAAEDFWGTMKESSKQPVDKVLASFIDLPGPPLLHVSESCTAGKRQVTIAQERLLPGNQAPETQTWTIPICGRALGSKANEPCQLTGEGKSTLTLSSSCDQPFMISRGGAGYFVVDYPPPDRAAFRKAFAELTPAERIAYHGNEWLLVRTLRRDAGEYLALLRALPRPQERPLVTAIADNLVYLHDRLAGDANRAAFGAFVHDALRGYAPVTWDRPAGETSEQRISRASVLWTLGYAAGDPEVIAGARRVAAQYMKEPSSVDALIGERALRLAAVHGDEAFLNLVMEQLAKAPSPELALRYRNLLPLFRDPATAARATDYIFSDKVRAQDLPIVASALLNDPMTRARGWEAVKSHWAEMEKRAPNALGRIVLGASGFCDTEAKKDVESFLAAHPTRFGQRGASRAAESINTCIAFRFMHQKSFDEALAAKSGGGVQAK
ncbi:MAG TPA: M1 family aminopeptidase [Thermoanaerobaculia bacterium]|nr:M1 family aminopeptidase [Thermoanaerobaculia bacterium]